MTHTQRTIFLLRRRWLTALDCARRGGCLSLSQRVSELRAAGYQVEDRWQKTRGGVRVKAYRLAKEA